MKRQSTLSVESNRLQKLKQNETLINDNGSYYSYLLGRIVRDPTPVLRDMI